MAIPHTYVREPAHAERVCQELRNERVLGYDLETTGTDPHRDVATLASFSTEKHAYVVDTRNADNLKIMAPLLESEDIIKLSHNAVFEYLMSKGTIGVDTERLYCTMLGEYAMTAGSQFSGYGLDDVLKKYCNIEVDKTLQASFIGHRGDFSKEQIEYSATDSFYMFPLAKAMQEKAKELGVLNTWINTECAAIQAFGDIEFYGQKINEAAWKRIMTENEAKAKEAKLRLDAILDPVCDRDLFGELVINYDSQPDVLSALQRLNIKVDGALIQNTNKKTQRKIRSYPVIQALEAYRSAVKLTGTYGDQYLKAIHPVTGRVHFRMNPYGTETGRPACYGGLNCLNIPRDKRYRNAFVTDDNRLISTVDYSAAELRIMADLSGDELMVKGFNSGVDFHCFVATMLFNKEVTKTNENKALRDPTKTLNFGLAYGMGPGSLYEQLNGMGSPITFDDCVKLFDKYKSTFRTTIKWLTDKQYAASRDFHASNINGRRRSWFRPNEEMLKEKVTAELTKNGRIPVSESMEWDIKAEVDRRVNAHLSAIRREGANFHIQSLNADFTKRSMARIRKENKKRGYDARMYNSVYDEIVQDVAASCGQEAHELQKKIMIEEANKMLSKVPMQVEGHLAPCWTK